MAAPQVTLQSITGVDVELRVAGVGSRSFAFVIDWHIRLILAFSWGLLGTFISFGGLTLAGAEPGPSFMFVVLLPALGIYFLYHPVLEIAMHGSTPGKRMAGVRIVTRTGDIPGAGALLVRNLFRLLDSLPFAYLIGLSTALFTAQHVRIGDLAAGTLLILDDNKHDKSFARLTSAHRSLDPRVADLLHELSERWAQLEEPTRLELARSLLARADKTLTPSELDGLNSAELWQRLQALLHPAQTS
ncbi:RDD family protein [Steroidobacter sp. S1-65]|uniref:RDD family protein n=1 Tax=Steroidobacter gossypii TaxID=2805490 RepID=A0ABS1WQB4_9GAMM|nr:RDD family protein [Steroidobacter gossypii]MBM0103148.1 RDD family protein [Steroidobacter gossypii]